MTRSDDLGSLPEGLPTPVDDGAADHLRGMALPPLMLPSTSGRTVDLSQLGPGCTVLYCYPRTGQPNEDPPGGLMLWNSIPGARGCTPQSCGYRNRHAELLSLGATVFGVSTQTTEYQSEMVRRLHLPFDVLSDHELRLATALRLPTFEFSGMTLLKRCTLLVVDGRIEDCFYPVFPSDSDVDRVLEWLRARFK